MSLNLRHQCDKCFIISQQSGNFNIFSQSIHSLLIKSAANSVLGRLSKFDALKRKMVVVKIDFLDILKSKLDKESREKPIPLI